MKSPDDLQSLKLKLKSLQLKLDRLEEGDLSSIISRVIE
jgi:hypothetical protein